MTPRSSMQTAWLCADGEVFETIFPPPHDEVIDGVFWGCFDEIFTPAFWKAQARQQIRRRRYTSHQLGNTLAEEVAACLLGGYGIPAELGLAAFQRIREAGLLVRTADESEFYESLCEPFEIDRKPRRYRFARQKARYLSASLQTLRNSELPANDLALRDFLLGLPGVGPKTASWIVRNHLNSSNVAIIDIHLLRAGKMINLFDGKADPTRQYFQLEDRFLKFCSALDVPAPVLDAIMWDYMRRVGSIANSANRFLEGARSRHDQSI